MLIGKRTSKDGFKRENKFIRTDKSKEEVESPECKTPIQTLFYDFRFKIIHIKEYLFYANLYKIKLNQSNKPSSTLLDLSLYYNERELLF